MTNPAGPTSPDGPLAGVRVIELGGIGPGPFAVMMLADLGATVLRIDRPATEDPIFPPERNFMLRGRPSAIVDLRDPHGVEVVTRLARTADVVVEANRPGVAERLGVGPEQLREVNPALVYGRMTGWGQDGPLALTAGHDIGYVALTGALHAVGEADGPPQIPVNFVGDFGGGAMFLVVGILAALLEARRTGTGQVVDASIVDGTAALTTMVRSLMSAGLWRDQRGSNLLDGGAPFYAVYETADGRHMTVGAIEPQFYAEFLRLLGVETDAGQHDVERWPELRALIARTFKTRTMAEWTAVFDGSDACVAPVLSLSEAPHHPHLAARGTFVTAYGQVQPAPAPRLSKTPATMGTAPDRAGQHTRQALTEWGIDEVDELLRLGVVVQT